MTQRDAESRLELLLEEVFSGSIDPELLVQYADAPESVDPELRIAIERLLRESPELSDQLAILKRFKVPGSA